MFSKLMLTEEERVVDPVLGYPHGYAKLCQHAAVQLQGLVTPFTAGPPQRFLPYSPQAEDFATLKKWDGLFPTVDDTERDPDLNARKHAEELWQQLDHLGNAGFDPAKFRVDSYGNVVYWNADPSSPLAWEIDHWFPHSRGGKTVVSNLRVLQWQASQRKKSRLEFLVPWWDLQHGCSINQFLSAFASKSADFRKRSFALFFSGGEDESIAREHVGECRPWPQHFREKKAYCGLAAAAIVTVKKEGEKVQQSTSPLQPLVVCDPPSAAGTEAKGRWSSEEEEALRRAVNKFGSGSWKEIKENEPTLSNRSIFQLKDKYRVIRVDCENPGKENVVNVFSTSSRSTHSDRHSSATTTLQKELRVKIMREEEKREKEHEIAELEETVMNLKQQNEKERLSAIQLEAVLTKHKRSVEKQRRWAEAQSSHRLCLERMIRDTMHQSISYKEQARLNQAACNALMARLDCQKAGCKVAEQDLLRSYSQRETLEAAVGDTDSKFNSTIIAVKKDPMLGREIVNGSNCESTPGDGKDEDEEVDKKVLLQCNDIIESDSGDETAIEIYRLRTEIRRAKDILHQNQQETTQISLNREIDDVTNLEKDINEEAEVLAPKVPSEALPVCGTKDMVDVSAHEEKITNVEVAGPPMQLDGNRGGSSHGEFADDDVEYEHHYPEEERSYDNQPHHRLPEVDAGLDLGISQVRTLSAELIRAKCAIMNLDSLEICDHLECSVPEPSDLSDGANPISCSRNEVQKNVIVVQSETSKSDVAANMIETAVVCKQGYLNELFHHVQLQFPTSRAAGRYAKDDLSRKSEEHLDDVLQQVLDTHPDGIFQADSRKSQSSDADDEKLRKIGKQNLDKWLQVLLFNVESAGSSPGQVSPLHRAFSDPPFSQISVAAMRGTLDLETNQNQELSEKTRENVESSKGLWGGLLRKLSARQQSDQCLSNKLDAESDGEVDVAKSQGIASSEIDNPSALNALNTLSFSTHVTSNNGDIQALDAQRCGGIANSKTNSVDTVSVVAAKKLEGVVPDHKSLDSEVLAGDTALKGVELGVSGCKLDQHCSTVKRYFPRPLSDVDEISETDSLNSNNYSDSRQSENKDPNKSSLRASIKAAGLAWKKAVKKL